MNSLIKRTVPVLTVGVLTLAACGGDDDDTAADTAPTSAPADVTTADTATDTTATTPSDDAATETTGAPADTATETTAAPASEPLISLAATDLGQVIVAADGLTLYMFAPDSDGEPTCSGACAGTWPPYYVEDGAELTAGDAIDPAALTVVAHPDGGNMLRYGDWPLYYYAGDGAPGETNGQGVNDVWWVIDGTGAPIQNTSVTSDGSQGGYYGS